MGKQSRLKASTKDKTKQLHPEAPVFAASAAPQQMEAAHVSPPPDPSADAFPEKAVAGAGKVQAVRSNSPTSAEEVQHLRTLNIILTKQMVEARQERDQDQVLLSDLEQGAVRAALASQLSQEVGRLTRLAEDRGRVEGADAAGREAAREMRERFAAAESNWMEAVARIERRRDTACEEAARLQRDLNKVAQEKEEVEKKLRKAGLDMDVIRGSLQDTRKALEGAQEDNGRFKQDLKKVAQEKAEVEKELRRAGLDMDVIRGSLQYAKKALEVAQEENGRFKQDLDSLLLEQEETAKLLDAQMEEKKALDVKIMDLEKRHEEARQALELARSEGRALAEDIKGKEAALEQLIQEKASLEESLAGYVQMAEDLERQMQESVLAKDEELNRVLFERDEARQGLHLQMQEMKDLVDRARQVAREELERALSQCKAPEQTEEEWKREMELLAASEKKSVVEDALRLLNKLSAEMVKAIDQAKREEQEQTKAEMETAMSKKDEELADLVSANFALHSELASLREEHQSLKAEEVGLRSKVGELIESNGDAQRQLEELRVEFKKRVEEEEKNARNYQSQVEGYLQQIEDMTRKMEEAKEQREEVEGKQKDEILSLQEKVAQLNSDVAALQDLSSSQAREKELLREEKNAVLGRLGEQTHKADGLLVELRGLEKTKRAVEQELGSLQTANAQLLEEKKQTEGRVASIGKEKASAQSSLADAVRRLEDAEKKTKALRELAKAALSMMESAAAEAAAGGHGGGEDSAVAEGGGGNKAAEVEDIRPFVVATEAIRVALSREAEMRQELKQQRANARWMWISSALAGVSATALASIAFVSRGR